jgi:hypothetical protein
VYCVPLHGDTLDKKKEPVPFYCSYVLRVMKTRKLLQHGLVFFGKFKTFQMVVIIDDNVVDGPFHDKRQCFGVGPGQQMRAQLRRQPVLPQIRRALFVRPNAQQIGDQGTEHGGDGVQDGRLMDVVQGRGVAEDVGQRLDHQHVRLQVGEQGLRFFLGRTKAQAAMQQTKTVARDVVVVLVGRHGTAVVLSQRKKKKKSTEVSENKQVH